MLCFASFLKHLGSELLTAKDWDLIEGLNEGDGLERGKFLLRVEEVVIAQV